jgi:hypothetical protein
MWRQVCKRLRTPDSNTVMNGGNNGMTTGVVWRSSDHKGKKVGSVATSQEHKGIVYNATFSQLTLQYVASRLCPFDCSGQRRRKSCARENVTRHTPTLAKLSLCLEDMQPFF